MELTKEQYGTLRELTTKLDRVLDSVRGLESKGGENAKYWNNRLGVLAEVMLQGGVVSKDDWAQIGKNHDYNVRGLGGYFVGPAASMVSIGNDRRAITEKGIKEVKSWLDGRLSIKPAEAQLKRYKSLLEEKKG